MLCGTAAAPEQRQSSTSCCCSSSTHRQHRQIASYSSSSSDIDMSSSCLAARSTGDEPSFVCGGKYVVEAGGENRKGGGEGWEWRRERRREGKGVRPAIPQTRCDRNTHGADCYAWGLGREAIRGSTGTTEEEEKKSGKGRSMMAGYSSCRRCYTTRSISIHLRLSFDY